MLLLAVVACEQDYDLDIDRDGFGQSIDCDDNDPTVYPLAPEVCDGIDNDCDGQLDDGVTTWFFDLDRDGYGDASNPVETCAPSDEMSLETGDCDDTNPLVSPETTWYIDADGDGWGLEQTSVVGCDPEGDWALYKGDCDDTDADKNPEAIWYLDNDGDGFAGTEFSLDDCDPGLPDFYLNGDDCNDDNPDIHPDASEQCDGVDNDCDDVVDNDEAVLGDLGTCAAASCLTVLDARPNAPDGVYWLDPDSSALSPFEAWCDMSTRGGGYSFLKLSNVNLLSAGSAETECARYGMQLFIPRNEDHLLAAYDVATSTVLSTNGSSNYLHLLGIYPQYDGARCDFQAMASDNGGCAWQTQDGGTFWVHDQTHQTEPNGDNRTHHSAAYTWSAGGTLFKVQDTTQGATSREFICDVGDRQD